MQPLRLAGSVVAFLGILLAAGSSTAAATWDKRILPQPFEREPFHQIAIPEWVEQTVGVGYTLSVQSSARRAEAARLGVTISEMGFVDPLYVYYDSKWLSRRNPHVPAYRLTNDLAEYKRLGIHVLAVYPPSLQGEVYEKHPDWRRVSTNTREIPQVDLGKYPHGGMLCLLGPYGDFFIEVLAEIAAAFPEVDAFSFDGLHYGGVCYCAHCRTDFRRDTGEEIPEVNLDDPRFRRYQHWADRRMEHVIQRLQARLKAIRPGIALVTWTTNAGRFGHLLDIPRNMPARLNLLLDAPDQEFWLDESNRGLTIVPAFACAYMWAVSNHRVAFSEPYLMSHGNPYGKDSFPGHEVMRRMLLALTHGVGPSIALTQPSHLQPAIDRSLAEVQRRLPWLTHKEPEPWAALVMSDNTRVFYGRHPGQVEDRYLAHVLGTFRAMLEEHLPVTLINDWNLTSEDLARFKVILLPNTACLDEHQIEALRQYVSGGGGLVGSLDVSLCDEFGNARTHLALADMFGVTYRGLPPASAAAEPALDVNFAKGLTPDYWLKRKNIWDLQPTAGSPLDSPRLKEYVGADPVTFKGQAAWVRVDDPSAQTVARLRPKSGAAGSPLPAVVLRAPGRGRTVYLAAGLDAAYYQYPYPYQRLLLKQAVLWAAKDAPPIQVDAPLCVQAVAMRQNHNGQRLVVHLYSDLNTTAAHAFPNDDVPLREETVPIHNVRVRFRGYQLGRVHLEPAGVDLKVDGGPEESTVTVPELDIHAMVVAELR